MPNIGGLVSGCRSSGLHMKETHLKRSTERCKLCGGAKENHLQNQH